MVLPKILVLTVVARRQCYENLELSQEMLDRIEDFREQENTYQVSSPANPCSYQDCDTYQASPATRARRTRIATRHARGKTHKLNNRETPSRARTRVPGAVAGSRVTARGQQHGARAQGRHPPPDFPLF